MALYYDASSVLTVDPSKGSLKSRIYDSSRLRSQPAHIYALITETSKCDGFLKEVVEKSDLLELEPKLTPLLALFLVHDFLFSKTGIAASTEHHLRQCIERNRARLKAEATKLRIKLKCADLITLKQALASDSINSKHRHRRWARLNVLRSPLPQDILTQLDARADQHIPDLCSFPQDAKLQQTGVYSTGKLILQDKGSCFPAYLLLGDQPCDGVGDVVDACAAPGNKTTHMAALLKASAAGRRIFACERDVKRSEILQTMIEKAGAQDYVDILKRQDFLALDPTDARFANVTHLLLDPSCSGSGILGREDIPTLKLPETRRSVNKQSLRHAQAQSKKRKRDTTVKDDGGYGVGKNTAGFEPAELDDAEEQRATPVDKERLKKLANLQSKIIEHAMQFPAAVKITYSTCSIHVEENEEVVARVLRSEAARRNGWQIFRRDDQPAGLKEWKHRGVSGDNQESSNLRLSEEESDACLRCYPDDDQGTMGFFVCGFVRGMQDDQKVSGLTHVSKQESSREVEETLDMQDNAWAGFSD